MDSRFAHLYKRDSSVSMIRVKMSRRRSQSQKENREKMQNLRRPLDQLQELELSLDASLLEKSVLPSQDTGCKDNVDKSKISPKFSFYQSYPCCATNNPLCF